MKFSRKQVIISIVIIILIVLVIEMFNPLRRSPQNIREYVLDLIPLNSEMQDVLKVIEEYGWKIKSVADVGYGIDKYGSPDYIGNVIVGDKRIIAYMGHYCGFFRVDVEIFFAFDDESNLIDVAIRKDRDML